jgi:ABC-type Fe3+ transport system permease subunit
MVERADFETAGVLLIALGLIVTIFGLAMGRPGGLADIAWAAFLGVGIFLIGCGGCLLSEGISRDRKAKKERAQKGMEDRPAEKDPIWRWIMICIVVSCTVLAILFGLMIALFS